LNNIDSRWLWLADASYIKHNTIPKLNTFWREVLECWCIYLKKSKQNRITESEILSESIWYNDNIKIEGKTIVNEEWHRKGVLFINDLVEKDGDLLSLETFKSKYDIQTNFLNYYGICKSIKSYYKQRGLQRLNTSLNAPILPYNLAQLKGNKKGSKDFYRTLTATTFTKVKYQYLMEDLLNIEYNEQQWGNINKMAYRCTDSTYLRWFQFKIIHNILPTNSFLHKIGYVDSPLCPLCKETQETVYHIFCECTYTKRIWKDLNTWLKSEDIIINITNEHILIGFKGKNNNPLNTILLLTKQFLYKQFRKPAIPHFIHLQANIKQYYTVTRCIAFSACNPAKFYTYWSTLHTLLQ
jgi:hypothetical protein